jgi:hypothetical protein
MYHLTGRSTVGYLPEERPGSDTSSHRGFSLVLQASFSGRAKQCTATAPLA